MTSDFEISIEWQGDRVSLDLSGDFNEESANSLIQSLQKECHDASVVFIRAEGLENPPPCGLRDVPQKPPQAPGLLLSPRLRRHECGPDGPRLDSMLLTHVTKGECP